MALKVIAADGRREVAEMENFNQAVEGIGISPEIVHRAFDRYFAETMPGS
jgi:signal transduction histidine kinase